MKVSELTGSQLDYWVAKALGWNQWPGTTQWNYGPEDAIEDAPHPWNPSTNWAHGGPIIEREGINPFSYMHDGERYWAAGMEGQAPTGTHGAKSLLIAAMRAYVTSKFGDEVPDEAEST